MLDSSADAGGHHKQAEHQTECCGSNNFHVYCHLSLRRSGADTFASIAETVQTAFHNNAHFSITFEILQRQKNRLAALGPPAPRRKGHRLRRCQTPPPRRHSLRAGALARDTRRLRLLPTHALMRGSPAAAVGTGLSLPDPPNPRPARYTAVAATHAPSGTDAAPLHTVTPTLRLLAPGGYALCHARCRQRG